MIDDLTTVLRLVVSVVLGGIIGFERQQRGKTAGLRTHVLVSLGSCLVSILSVNLYMGVQGLTNADPARLAAQVVSGIGFLGAGAIMKEGPMVKGLTTAASLWVVASVGLAVGVGAITGAVATTVLVVITLELLPRIDKLYNIGTTTTCPQYDLAIYSQEKAGQIGRIGSVLGTLGVSILQIHIEDGEAGNISIPLTVKLPEKVKIEQVIAELHKIDGILTIKESRRL